MLACLPLWVQLRVPVVIKGCYDCCVQALQFEGGTHIVSSGALATLSGALPGACAEPLPCTCIAYVEAVQE